MTYWKEDWYGSKHNLWLLWLCRFIQERPPIITGNHGRPGFVYHQKLLTDLYGWKHMAVVNWIDFPLQKSVHRWGAAWFARKDKKIFMYYFCIPVFIGYNLWPLDVKGCLWHICTSQFSWCRLVAQACYNRVLWGYRLQGKQWPWSSKICLTSMP